MTGETARIFNSAIGAAAIASAFELGLLDELEQQAIERALPPLPQETGPLLGQAAELVFRRVDQTLAARPVTNGRSSVEWVDAVATFTGSAFRLPPAGQSLLTLGPSSISLLPEVAWEFSEATPRHPIGG